MIPVYSEKELGCLDSNLYSIIPYIIHHCCCWCCGTSDRQNPLGDALKALSVLNARATVESDRSIILKKFVDAFDGDSNAFLQSNKNLQALDNASDFIRKSIFQQIIDKLSGDYYGYSNVQTTVAIILFQLIFYPMICLFFSSSNPNTIWIFIWLTFAFAFILYYFGSILSALKMHNVKLIGLNIFYKTDKEFILQQKIIYEATETAGSSVTNKMYSMLTKGGFYFRL